MIKEINEITHYVIPGTNNKYYINDDGDVYSIRKKDYLSKKHNTVKLTIYGEQKRISVNTLLLDTYREITRHLNEQNKEMAKLIMHYYK